MGLRKKPTKDAKTFKNPYMDEIERLKKSKRKGTGTLAKLAEMLGHSTPGPLDWVHRNKLVQKYSFAIPNQDAIRTLVELSPIVEIGAGSGYWAHLISEMGGVVKAFDRVGIGYKPIEGVPNIWQWKKQWFPVIMSTETRVRFHPNHTLFLCWPYMCPMAYNALRLYQGQAVVYVGEPKDGNCAETDFFELLEKDWEKVKTVNIPQWYGMNDVMFVYKRKIKNAAL